MGLLRKFAEYLNKRAGFDSEPSPVTGDVLIVRDNEVRTVLRGAGADGDVLTLDSAEPCGVSWQTPAGGGGGGDNGPDLTAIEALTGTGGLYRIAADTWALRTLGAPAEGLTIANPAGIAGPPTFALANDLAALEGLGSTGYGVRTAANTWAQRTFTSSDGSITIANPAGIAGDTDLSAKYQGPIVTVYNAAAGAEIHHPRPTGHTQVRIEGGDGGGGGGAGRSAGAGLARGGGGGGGLGAWNAIETACPPDMYVKVGLGGTGGVAGGGGATDGTRSTVSRVSGSTADHDLIFSAGGHATSGGGQGNAGSAAAAAGGGAGQIATESATSGTAGRHGSRGLSSPKAGQGGGAGGNGTSSTAGATITPPTFHPGCAGAGGGAVSTGNAHVAAGAINAAGASAGVAAGAAGGGAGNNGAATGSDPGTPETWTGGSGGGGNNAGTGGKGGDGSICSGGGGGGGGTTGGNGGNGGPGRIIITTW